MTNINSSIWNNLLEWAYNKALRGTGGMDKASALAMRYADPSLTLNQQVDALIRRQKLLAGSSGFLTGLGGIMTLPFTIPANLASVVFIQLRMIAAIAFLGGHDLEDKKVKNLVFACMAGNAAKDIIQEISIQSGRRVTRRLLARSGFAKLGKMVPLAGGLIGGSIDVLATAIIGKLARKTFIEEAA
jgi:uncharacterized protein (DUF697 family)